MNSDFCVRELSAPGRGAVSVLALEGPGAAALLERLCGARLPAPGGLALVHLREGGLELDEALLAVHAPGLYELHVHGSPPLVRRLLALSTSPPEPLSFESRARELLARAQGAAAARMLLDQAQGALRRELGELERASAERRKQVLSVLAERARVARWLLEPARVVIAGPTNAGKSTLFNALLGEGRAIVHEQAGTTRDALREQALFGAYPVWLHDTAGERALAAGERGAEIEAQGQRRARLLAQTADLVLWLDPSGSTPAELAPNMHCLHSRSALEQPELARARVAEILRTQLCLPEQPWTPGAGVPLEPKIAAELATLDPALAPAEWSRAVAAVLGDCQSGPNAVL